MNQHSYEIIQKWSQKFGGKIKIKTLSLNFFDVDLPPKDVLEYFDLNGNQESFENRTNFLAKGLVEEDFIEKLLTTFQNVAYPGKFFKSIKIEASTERSNQWIDVLKSFGILLTKENVKDKQIKFDLRLHDIDDKRFIQVGEIKRSDDWFYDDVTKVSVTNSIRDKSYSAGFCDLKLEERNHPDIR
uniref:Uncharacterized protein n=1 Tax=Acrobeloides nanus TaxID=290746 RepID=A0A914D834_9BILA